MDSIKEIVKWRDAMEMPPQTPEQAAALVKEELREVMEEIESLSPSRDKIGLELSDLIVTAVGLAQSCGIDDLTHYLSIVLQSNYTKIMTEQQFDEMCRLFPIRNSDNGTMQVQKDGEWLSVKKSLRDGQNFYTLSDKNNKLRKPHTYIPISEFLNQEK
jgi:NTP pyrophosphatase (non-canonical NTP hydrolase)